MTDWISVKDRLPDNDYSKRLIVACKTNRAITSDSGVGMCNYYDDDFRPVHIIAFYCPGEISQLKITNVTHWMPFPEPPEET